MLVIYINLLPLSLFNQTFYWFMLCKTVVFRLGFGQFLYLPCVTLMPLDSLLQVLVVQVGQGVRGFQGCQAHHLFLVVPHFPREKWRRLFSLSQMSPEVEGLKPENDNGITQRSRTAPCPSFNSGNNPNRCMKLFTHICLNYADSYQ